MNLVQNMRMAGLMKISKSKNNKNVKMLKPETPRKLLTPTQPSSQMLQNWTTLVNHNGMANKPLKLPPPRLPKSGNQKNGLITMPVPPNGLNHQPPTGLHKHLLRAKSGNGKLSPSCAAVHWFSTLHCSIYKHFIILWIVRIRNKIWISKQFAFYFYVEQFESRSNSSFDSRALKFSLVK